VHIAEHSKSQQIPPTNASIVFFAGSAQATLAIPAIKNALKKIPATKHTLNKKTCNLFIIVSPSKDTSESFIPTFLIYLLDWVIIRFFISVFTPPLFL
jgi:hypothetical protein